MMKGSGRTSIIQYTRAKGEVVSCLTWQSGDRESTSVSREA